MKAKGILIALKMVELGNEKTNQIELAKKLGLCQAEISNGLKRLSKARLLNADHFAVISSVLLDFFVLWGARSIPRITWFLCQGYANLSFGSPFK